MFRKPDTDDISGWRSQVQDTPSRVSLSCVSSFYLI